MERNELPFGDAFKQYWEDYVLFVEDKGWNASIKSQNDVLIRLQKDCKTYEEAVNKIEACKEVINRLQLKRLLNR
jgi:hypothetical protein